MNNNLEKKKSGLLYLVLDYCLDYRRISTGYESQLSLHELKKPTETSLSLVILSIPRVNLYPRHPAMI
jgi:hypothetical protein